MKNRIYQTILLLTFVTQFSFAQNNLQYVSKVCANTPQNVIRNGNYLDKFGVDRNDITAIRQTTK